MNGQLNNTKSYLVFSSLLFLYLGCIILIIHEISINGVSFCLPYLTYLFLGISVLTIELKQKKSLVSNKPSFFLRLFFSFDSIGYLFILTFFSFCEVFLGIQIIKLTLEYLYKLLNPETEYTFIHSYFIIYLTVIYWMLLLYAKLFTTTQLKGFKVIRFIVIVFLISLISMIFYDPKYLIEYFNNVLHTINLENKYFLKPKTVFNLKVWQNSAGKIFILTITGHFLYRWWRIKKNTSNYSSFNFGMTLLIIISILIGSAFIFYSQNYFSLITELTDFGDDKLDVLLISISACLIFLTVLLNNLNSILFEQNKNMNYPLTIDETKYLTRKNILFLSISLVGLSSGFLFIFVDFNNFFYWTGMIFLALLIVSCSIYFLDNFSYNRFKKRFYDRNAEIQLSPAEKFNLKFILPVFLISLLLISLPDYFSNFIGNKQLTEKIEYLQDLGRITSYHHSIEPFIVRDYNEIVLDIDSNKVQLDKIDSLKSYQKDSIQFYLENKNYKMNENRRIEKLQFHHDIVFIKNFCRWSLLVLLVFILFLYRYKLVKSE